MSGSIREPATDTIDDLGNLDPTLESNAGTLTLDRTRFGDLYDNGRELGAELGYAFSKNLEGFGRVSYDDYGGRNVQMGTLTSDAFESPSPLDADFADEKSLSLQLGARYYWAAGSQWRPFVGAALGATHMDAMTASFTVPGTNIDVPEARFSNADTVFTQSAEAGLEYEPTPSFGLRFAVDADHFGHASAADDDPGLTQLGIDSTENPGNRWTFPITLTASWRFGQPG
jgi:opacity protein-like surface antigen